MLLLVNHQRILSSIKNAIVFPMEQKKVQLFCLPFAGGSAPLIYNKWKTKLSENIILKPIELAGRGSRIVEKFYNGVPAAVEDIYSRIKKELNGQDYAIFGHSMGAFLAYEVAQKMQAAGDKMPLRIFFSGRHAPNIRKWRGYATLSDEEFKQRVLDLGATPKAIFENPEFLRIFLPILRHDFKIADSPNVREKITPLNCDLTVLIGEEEDISQEEAQAWKLHTSRNCAINYIQGGHFFILNNQQKVLDIVNDKFRVANTANEVHRVNRVEHALI